LPSICETLSFIPSTKKEKKKKTPNGASKNTWRILNHQSPKREYFKKDRVTNHAKCKNINYMKPKAFHLILHYENP
jgi:hypothetical protein